MVRSRYRVLALLVVLALSVPAQVGAQTPPLLNWGEILPGLTPGIDTSDSNVCKAGRPQCVESVLRTMARELQRLARSCDHDAVFQLGYLRTTEAYYESSQIPGFYDDVPWMHHYDAVFAEYYMSPQRAWAQGRTAEVPPAWRQAFEAAEGQEISSLGNFLLGMNAHINRDLPFVLDDIGLTDAEGASRKPDHEAVNEFLNHVADDMSPEIVARLDPAFDTSDDDDLLVGLAAQQVIQGWREQAWTNASMMTYLPPPLADLVAEGIEAGSTHLATLLRAGLQSDPAARNAHCAVHWDDWAGGDGTYFDGADEPAISAPAIDLPNATPQLAALAALGVHVDVSVEAGVGITLRPDLLTGVGDLLGDVPVLDVVAPPVSTVGGGLGAVGGTTTMVGGLPGGLFPRPR